MRWKPLSQWINIWVFLSFFFQHLSRTLARIRKWLRFLVREQLLSWFMRCLWNGSLAITPEKCVHSAPAGPPLELPFGVSVHTACLARNKRWPSYDCALTSANPLLYGTIFRQIDKGEFSLSNIVTLSVSQRFSPGRLCIVELCSYFKISLYL